MERKKEMVNKMIVVVIPVLKNTMRENIIHLRSLIQYWIAEMKAEVVEDPFWEMAMDPKEFPHKESNQREKQKQIKGRLKQWQQEYPHVACFIFPLSFWCWSVWVHDDIPHLPFSLSLFDQNGGYHDGLLDAGPVLPCDEKHPLSHHPLLKSLKKSHKKNPFHVIWEGMGGLGKDTLFLLSLGCPLIVWERNPILAFLWTMALSGLSYLPTTSLPTTSVMVKEQNPRLSFIYGDFWKHLEKISQEKWSAEKRILVYLDPFFSETKKSHKRLPPGEIQCLKQLQSLYEDPQNEDPQNEDPQINGIHHLELNVVKKISLQGMSGQWIVKRPLKGVGISGFSPNGSVVGKTLAWDIYASDSFT
jgi:hypothetical protein